MLVNHDIITQGMKKTAQTHCSFKVCAVGFDKNGKYLGISRNTPFQSGKGRGLHAEVNLIKNITKGDYET